MGKNSTHETLRDIGEVLSTKPQSIKEIMNETGRDRATVSKYLRTLSKVGLIKEDKLGRQKIFWKPTLSDRQTGLELRGMGYKIQKMQEMLDDVQERNDELIDETCDPSFSKRNRQTEESS